MQFKKGFAIAMTLALMALNGCAQRETEVSSVAACTEANAREVTQNFITNASFDLPCVKVAAGTQFFFINNDDEAHTVTTEGDAPEAFDAELPRKNSTFAQSFSKPGRYVFRCKSHAESMTLFVA